MNSEWKIKEIRQYLEQEEVCETFLAQLKKDTRKGVRQLVSVYEKKQYQAWQDKQRFEEMSRYEKIQYQQGNVRRVAGIDEAGRGPLAGPVVAAAVILEEDFYLAGLNDSKQLSAAVREKFFHIIQAEAVSCGIGVVHNEEIDRINIFQATKKAMAKAVADLSVEPAHLLVDAVRLESLPYSADVVTKGDQKSVSIAAASIVAKVTRDRMMTEMDEKYPGYGFANHKGYGTKAHLQAVKKLGVSPWHRLSFAPLKES